MSEDTNADQPAQPPRVEFDLGEYGGPISIPANEVRQWRDRELAGLRDWVSQLRPNEHPQLVGVANGALKDIRQRTEPPIADYENRPGDASVSAISEALAQQFKKHRFYVLATPQGRLIQELAATDRSAAAGALAYLWGVPQVQVSGGIVRGMFRAFALEHGISDRPEKESQALAALRTEWQENLIKDTKTADEQRTELQSLLAQHRADATRFAADAAKQLEGQAAAHKEQHDTAKQSLDALEATFTAGLALKAPVTYWSNKRHYHAERGKATARWVAWYFAGGVVVAAIVAGQLLNIESRSALGIPLWHLALFASVLALFVWGARILVRLMLSHQHLEVDAYERVVIANTFLALVRGDRLPEGKTDAVLEALLRHSPDGIVRDDALPLMADMLKRAE